MFSAACAAIVAHGYGSLSHMALLDGHGSPEGGAAAPSPKIPNQSQSTSEVERLSTLIAEQNSQLAALRETDEQFRGAFEQAAVGMIMADADGRLDRKSTRLNS